jgi:hypothetical protein
MRNPSPAPSYSPYYAIQASKRRPQSLLIGLSLFSIGAALGWQKSKIIAKTDNENYSENYLKTYVSEEQINL